MSGGGDHVSGVVLMPVAERLGLRLLDGQAKRAEHGERCDGKEGGSHVGYGAKSPAFFELKLKREVLTSKQPR